MMGSLATALAAGIIFGAGVTIAQMVNPEKVINFLDVAGNWDPSLALVMGSAVAVTTLLFRVVLRRPAPLCAVEFQLPAAKDVDRRLIGGAALFGAGWGLAGYCPGPAVASLAYGLPASTGFVLSMIVGMALWEWGVASQSAAPVLRQALKNPR